MGCAGATGGPLAPRGKTPLDLPPQDYEVPKLGDWHQLITRKTVALLGQMVVQCMISTCPSTSPQPSASISIPEGCPFRNRNGTIGGAPVGFHQLPFLFGCRLQKGLQQLNTACGFKNQRLRPWGGGSLIMLGGCLETVRDIGSWNCTADMRQRCNLGWNPVGLPVRTLCPLHWRSRRFTMFVDQAAAQSKQVSGLLYYAI